MATQFPRAVKVTFTVIGAILSLALFAPMASANSAGQCNVTRGNAVTSTTEWRSVLKKEGVTSQAAKLPFKKAGYVSGDQTISQWMTQRVMRGKVAKSFSGQDYGCRDGKLFDAGRRSYHKGKGVFYVLPKTFDKKEVKTTKPKTNSKSPVKYERKRIRVIVIGLDDCGNPFFGYAYVDIWVPVTPETTKPDKDKPTTSTTPEAPSCPVGSKPVMTASGLACQIITVTGTNDAKVDNNCEGPNNNSPQCNTQIIQNITQITINANCAMFTINYSDGTTLVEYRDNNGNVVTQSICSQQTTTVTPPPIQTITYTATVTVTVNASASATVVCPSNSTTATASATAIASGSASGSATSTVSQADADAKADATARPGAIANANANAYAKAQVDAYVKCVPKTPELAAPVVSCVFPAHVYKGGNVKVWCEYSVANNVAIAFDITGGTPYAHLSGKISGNGTPRWDGSACPTNVTCFRAELWGDQVTPAGIYAHFVATASANNKSTIVTGDVPILLDDFGDKSDPVAASHDFALDV